MRGEQAAAVKVRALLCVLMSCLASLGLGCIPVRINPAVSQEIPFDLTLAKRVVEEIRAGRISVDASQTAPGLGSVPLPKRFASAAFLGVIYITRGPDGTLVVFFPTGGCRSSNTGYLYSSKPLRGKSVNINCGWSDKVTVPLVRQVTIDWWWTQDGCSQT